MATFLIIANLSILIAVFGTVFAWMRLVYLVDAFIHIYILGFGLSQISGIPMFFSMIGTSFIFSLFVFLTLETRHGANLILTSNFLLALGLVLLGVKGISFHEIEDIFMPSIHMISDMQIGILSGFVVLTLTLLMFSKKQILRNALTPSLMTKKFDKLAVFSWIFLGSSFIGISLENLGLFTANSLILLPSYIALRIAKSPNGSLIIAFLVAFFGIGVVYLAEMFIKNMQVSQAFVVIILFVLYGLQNFIKKN
jgi:ABC-type Mn2+/Zn2+ transport system permease subunit